MRSRRRAKASVPSMGCIADRFDHAVIESFWARVPVELLDRKRWRIRIELADAMFEYLKIWQPTPPAQRLESPIEHRYCSKSRKRSPWLSLRVAPISSQTAMEP